MSKSSNNNNPNNSAKDSSRRQFLKNSGYAAGGLVGGGLLFGLLNNPFKSEEVDTSVSGDTGREFFESRMFFTRVDDFAILEQATERIFPEDDNGPGAIELGVPIFIDKQLAGDFGSNKKDYMHAPMREVEGIESYQTLMNRGEVFIEGLRKMDTESQKRHDEKFTDLEDDQMDEILQDMQDGEIELKGVRATTFFKLLRQMTIEGAYSNPLYGGNKDMKGWKMREHPGLRASYKDLIDSEEFQKLDPVSLKDYQQ